MASSAEGTSETESIDSSPVTRSKSVLRTSGEQVKTALKRPFDSIIETDKAPDASTHTGASQDLENVSIRSSVPENSPESDVQLSQAPPGKQTKTAEQITEAPPDKQAQNMTEYCIDISPFSNTNLSNSTNSLSYRKLKAQYARDENRKLQLTAVKFDKYSRNRDIRPNLLRGYTDDQMTQNQTEERQMFSITKFHEYLKSRIDLLSTSDPPNFVSTVATLKGLMCASYQPPWKKLWNVYAKKVDGMWYLSEGWKDREDGVSKRKKYAARFFELLMTNDRSLEKAEQEAKSFLKHAHTYEVFEAGVGAHRLLYSGEVDCYDSDEKTLELKTIACEEKSFPSLSVPENTLRYYWAQAHLMGNSKIVVGFWNNESGALIRTNDIETERIQPNTWKRENCIACLDHILDQFKSEFFKDAGTYVLQLNATDKKIVAKKSDIDLPLEVEND